MSNKISGLENRPVQVSSGAAARPVGERGAARPDAGKVATDDLHITDTARTLVSLEQSVKDMPPIDDFKVVLVRDALRDGNYQIDPDKIAGKLLRLEQELSGGK